MAQYTWNHIACTSTVSLIKIDWQGIIIIVQIRSLFLMKPCLSDFIICCYATLTVYEMYAFKLIQTKPRVTSASNSNLSGLEMAN